MALPGKTFLEQYADRQNTLSQKHTLAHPHSHCTAPSSPVNEGTGKSMAQVWSIESLPARTARGKINARNDLARRELWPESVVAQRVANHNGQGYPRQSNCSRLGKYIGLFTAKARSRGQQEAKLPEAARKIEWL